MTIMMTITAINAIRSMKLNPNREFETFFGDDDGEITDDDDEGKGVSIKDDGVEVGRPSVQQ